MKSPRRSGAVGLSAALLVVAVPVAGQEGEDWIMRSNENSQGLLEVLGCARGLLR